MQRPLRSSGTNVSTDVRPLGNHTLSAPVNGLKIFTFQGISQFALLLLMLLGVWLPASAQDLIDKFKNKVNGTVYAVAVDETNGIVYLGGDFTKAGNLGAYGAALDPTSGELPASYPQPNGTISASCADGNGGYYIGGSFTQVGDSIRRNLAHINAAGVVTTWARNAKPNATVRAIVADGATVYIGGDFIALDAWLDSRGAALNLTDGQPDRNFPIVNGTINATISDGNGGWYIGGNFTKVGTENRKNLAHITSAGVVTDFMKDLTLDNSISALYLDNGTLYIGGAFTRIDDQTSFTDSRGALINDTGLPNLNFPKVNGAIIAVVADGAGGWYIGGGFTQVGSASRNRLAQIDATGNVTDWNPNANSSVLSLAVSGSTVYAGGQFTNIGGQSRNRIAALNVSDGLATTWNPNANSQVESLAVSGTTVYAGGSFTTIGGQSRNRIAALNVSDGLATTWNPNASSTVTSLAVSGTTVYAGGYFTTIGGQSRNRIAALNVSDGLATTWNPNANNTVFSLAVSGTTVYAGGYFDNIGGQSRVYIAALNVSDGLATTWNPNANGGVRSLEVSGSTVYAGGYFTTIGGQSRNYIVALNVSDGLATTWNPNANSTVWSLAVSSSTVYAGGDFTTIGGQSRNRIAALNVSDGLATTWNPNANGGVRSLAVSGSTVYAGGLFTTIGGQSRNRIAALNVSDGLATTWNPNANSQVQSLAVSGSTVYAGGVFTTIGGQSRNRIAALNVSDGLATTWNPNADNQVLSLAVSGSTVYAGGGFTTIGGQSRNYIAALNVSDGLATTWNPNANNWVISLAVSGSTVYAGGQFTAIGGQSRNYIAALNVSDGLATTWNPNANNTVASLAVSGSTVYAGGLFTTVGGQNRNRIAALNVSDGLATSWNPDAKGGVLSLAVSGSTVYAGGTFTTIGGQSRNRIAALNISDGLVTSWNPNANSDVQSLAVSGSTVYAGGTFTTIGGQPRNKIAALNVSDGLATTWNPSADNQVNSLAVSGSTVYAGGHFSTIGGQIRNYIAALNVSDGLATTWNPNANSNVQSLAVSGSTVYAGGGFRTIGGQSRNYIAALNVSDGLATTWNPNANNWVISLAVSGSTVYAGGGFTAIGGSTRNRLAALNVSDGQVTSWNPDANSSVSTLAVLGSTVYVGGFFTNVGGQPRNYIAALNASDGLATSWNPNANNAVSSLIVSGSSVYAGGYFTNIGGQTRNYIAALNVSNGLANTWNPIADNRVFSLALSGSTLYAGGQFTNVGGQTRNRIAALSVSNGLATNWNPNANNTVLSLAVTSSTVYVGGDFTTIGGQSRNRIAALDVSDGLATTWNPNANGSILTLAVSGSTIYAGGNFNSIGGASRTYLAALNVSDGMATTWDPSANNSVRSLAVSGSTVYAGGSFNSIGGQPSNGFVGLTPSLSAQSITFSALSGKAYGDASFQLAGSASSSLAVTYTSSNLSVATISGTTVTIVGAGQTTITASQAGNSEYTAATSVEQIFTVSKAGLTVTANNETITYGDPEPAYSISYSGFVNSEDESVLDTEPSGVSSSTAVDNVGTYVLQVAQDGADNNYDFSYQDGELTVGEATLTITADTQTKIFGETDPALTYQSSGLIGSDAVTGELSRAAGENVGDYAIAQNTVTAGSNYTIAYTGAELGITPKDLTVTADAKSKVYGATDPALTYQSAGLVGTDAITGALSRAAGENVGDYTIAQNTVTAGNNYTIAYTGAELGITPKDITVTADTKSKVYGATDPSLSYQSSGLVGTDAITGSLSRAAGENVGDYAIAQNTVTAGDNYTIAYTGAELGITPKDITVTADTKSKVYGATDPSLTYQSAGLVGTDAITGALSRAAGENVGDYAIAQNTVTAGSNYTIAYTGADLGITPKDITVTADTKSKVYGATDPLLTYQSSGLVGTDAITGSLSRSAGENVGDYAIAQNTVTAGNNYTIAYTGAELGITPKDITVTADTKSKVYGATDPALTYQSSGLVGTDAITGALSRAAGENVGDYAITQNTVTAGNNYTIAYTGAELGITPKDITVTADTKSKVYGATDPALTYQSAGLVGTDAITGALSRAAGENVGDYAIAQNTVTAGNNYTIAYTGADLGITPKDITVTADTKSKVYGETDPELTYQSSGLVGSDAITGELSRAAGENVGDYAIAQNTVTAGSNYTNAYTGAELGITPKDLTVTADTKSKVYGEADPALTYQSSGLVGTDAINGELSRAAGENVGDYAIAQNTVTAGSNYTIAYSGADLGITPKDITVTADTKSKVYGAADPALTYQSSGLIGTDAITGVLSRTVGENVGDYAIAQNTVTAGNNYTIAYTGAQLGITPKDLTVTADTKSKVYGATDPSLTYQSAGLVGTDAITGSLSRSAGENVGDYAIAQNTVTAGSNYTIAYTGAELGITPKDITVTADTKSKVYGATDPSLTYQSAGLIGTDAITGALSRAAGENVGDYAIAQNTVTAGSNYTIAYTGAELGITPKDITVTAETKSKVYGETDPELTYQSAGLVVTDAITGALSRVAGENVGDYAIAQNTVTAGDNYTIAYTGADLGITPKDITVTADTKSKVYGATDPLLTYQSSGLVGTDAITGSLSRSAGENVGDYAIAQNTVTAGNNYSIAYTGADLGITPKDISVTADTKSKVYGETNPSLTYQSSGLVGTDVITGALSRAAGENVGDYAIAQNTVTAGSNYTVAFTGADLGITPKDLTVTADTKIKVYGATDPSLTYQSSGLVGTDAIAGALSRTAGEDVGDYAIAQNTLTAGNNYTIAYTGAELGITPKDLTVTADTKSKVYGAADPALTYQSSGLVGTDAITGALSRAAGENVGDYAIAQNTVTAGSNYTIAYTGAELGITPKDLTVTADTKSKVYGAADPALTYQSSGLLGTDAITGTLSRAAGENVGDYAIAQNTVTAGNNYTIAYTGAELGITPKDLTVTADTKSKVYGETDPALTYQSSGLVGTDAITGALSRTAGENVGDYAIAQNTVTAGSNYTIAYTGAELGITPKDLTVTADTKSKVYGTTDPALTYQSSGLVGTDAMTGALRRAAGEDVGDYAIAQNTVTAGNNYTIAYTGAELGITPKDLTVTADTKSKVYGATDPSLTYQSSGLVGTDAITGALSRAAGEDVGDYAIAQNTVTAGNNYTIAYTGAELGITPKDITVTADTKTKVYGTTDPSLTYQSSGLVGTDAITGALSRAAGENVGDYGIAQNTVTAGNNYTIAYSGANLGISKASLKATAEDFEIKQGDEIPSLTIVYEGFAFSDDQSVLDTPPVASTSTSNSSIAGSFAITLTAGSDNNYIINTVNGTLSIEEILGTIGEGQNLVSIFPNPVINTFQLDLNGQQATHFALVDLQGKVAKRFLVEVGEYDISNLSNGLYVLILEGKNGSWIAGKLYKN